MYEVIKYKGEPPKATNYIEDGRPQEIWDFATTNPKKLEEIERILGRPVNGVALGEVPEDQYLDDMAVIEAKAIAAWERNGRRPVIVEDTTYTMEAWDLLPGTYTKDITKGGLDVLCEIAKYKKNNRVMVKTIFALFDGRNRPQIREGTWYGTIPDTPRGPRKFNWDTIFIPDGQENLPEWDGIYRTYAELTQIDPRLKDMLSMRADALQKLRNDPFVVKTPIFQLDEPYWMQMEAVNRSLLRDPQVMNHAYNIDILSHVEPNPNFDTGKPRPPQMAFIGKSERNFRRYIWDQNEPDLGLVITPMDLAVDLDGDAYRLRVDNYGEPEFWQMGPEALKMALAARAVEFRKFHNEKIYEMLLNMLSGKEEYQTPKRTHQRSAAIEELIKMTMTMTPQELDAMDDAHWDEAYQKYIEGVHVGAAAGFAELAIARQYSADPENKMSRTAAADSGLFVTRSGIPSSIFSLGGMPPVSGNADVIATAALSYMDSYISHNSLFAGDFDRQLRLFDKAVAKIKKLKLPKKIEDLVIAHLGICIGTDDEKTIEDKITEFKKHGGSLARIYTTNTDFRVVDAARAVRKWGGEKFRICVGPIVDMNQARALRADDIKVNILLFGHGGGENCTSLEDGGAANALALAYQASLESPFDDCDIGLEGGVGTGYGPLLRFIDRFSLNRRGIAGGVEAGGLYMRHNNDRICLPYWGTASPGTQWTEIMNNLAILEAEGYMADEIFDSESDIWNRIKEAAPLLLINLQIIYKRLDEAARLINNEGKLNYMNKPRAINSIVDAWHVARMLAGRGLADQKSRSVHQLRAIVIDEGHPDHTVVSPEAKHTADHHRS